MGRIAEKNIIQNSQAFKTSFQLDNYPDMKINVCSDNQILKIIL